MAAELVYSMSLRLPGEFSSPSSSPATPGETYISRLKLSMRNLRANPPRAPNTRNTFVDQSLFSASYVLIRRDSVKKPLEQLHDGPFKVLSCTDKYYILDINGKQDTVSIDRLKAAHLDSTHTLSPPSSPTLSPASTPSVSPVPITQPPPTVRTRSGHHIHFPDRLNL